MVKRKSITKMRLYRFQAHIDTVLYFDPVSTAIIGATDVGKSAITRALYWTLYNKPARIGHPGTPDEYTTWGENHCFVTITFNDGTEITRGRRGNENYYNLIQADGTKLPFKGFGFNVPEAIMEAHGMYPLIVDDKELSLNITQQHDSIFMLEEGAPLRAKVVGKLSGADKADGAIGVVNSWYRSTAGFKKLAEEQLDNTNTLISAYDFLDDIADPIQQIENIVLEIQHSENISGIISNTYNTLSNLETQKHNISVLMEYETSVVDIDSLLDTAGKINNTVQSIKTLLHSHIYTTNERGNLESILLETSKIENIDECMVNIEHKISDYTYLAKILGEYYTLNNELETLSNIMETNPILDNLSKVISNTSQTLVTYNTIKEIINSYSDIQTRLATGYDYISKLEAESEEIVAEYVETLSLAKICPMCYADITSAQLSKISAEGGL